jgi:DNA-binding LacI/PurR family transcriptional regulator
LRERVLATADELGYSGPDPAARRLRSGGPGAVGLLFTESLAWAFTDPAAVMFLQGFATAIEEAGLSMVILPGYGGRPGTPHSGRAAGKDAIREAVVDGFCSYSLPEGNADLVAARERRLPLVIVDQPRGAGTAFVGTDDQAGARMAAEHLLGLGHRRFGVIAFRTADDDYTGPLTPEREANAQYPVSRARLAGWREGLEAAGVDWHAVPKHELLLRDLGGAAVRELLERDPGITALLCSTDRLAFGVLDALPELGREDMSVVGFDDLPAAGLRNLTTVRQPLLEKGLVAGRLLVEPDGDGPAEVILPVELVPRGSTRPPAA